MSIRPAPPGPAGATALPDAHPAPADGLGRLLDDVLRASVVIYGTETGDIRLFHPDRGTFSIVAAHGLDADPSGDGSEPMAGASEAWSQAVRTGRPVVLGDLDGQVGEGAEVGNGAGGSGGYRSLQVTPLLDRTGQAVGVLSAYLREPHRASAEDLALAGLHARMAAELLVLDRVQATLREREERYRSLFESIDEGFCTCEMVVDEDGRAVDYRFLEVNPLFNQMTGIRPDPVGRTARELVPGLEDRWIQRYAQVALRGESIRFEEGSEAMGRWFDVYAFPTGGLRFAILFRDVTDRKRSDEALQLALAAKDEFLGLVSHELRTPMTVILGMSRLLGREVLDPTTARDVASEIGDSAEELNALVESMLLLARLDHDETSRLREPILLNRAAAQVLERHRAKDPRRSFELRVNTTETLVDVQGTLLEQVIDNLVLNAAKYSAPGRPITVVLDSDGRHARLLVLDEGVGIAEEELRRIFEPFYRSPFARRQASGAGLGLAVCKRIVELLGGRIWAAQRPTGGAEFGFELPLLLEEDEGWGE